MKKVLSVVMILTALCVLGCSKSQSKAGTPAASAAQSSGPKKYKIAFSNSYVGNAWRTASVNIFNAYTNRLVKEGILEKAYCSSAGNDVQAQINEIRNMMSEGYDAIVTIAASETGLNSVLEEAVDRGIVVVAFDAHIDSPKVYNVNTDQHEYGRLLADFLVKQLGGKGNILWIKGIEGNAVTINRTAGMESVLKNYPDVKVLGEGYGKWDLSTAAEVMANLMSAHAAKGIDGVLSEGGGGHAIVESLIQYYGLEKAKKMPIAEGEMFNAYMKDWVEMELNTFTTAQPPYLSAAAVDVALKVLRGESAERMTLINLPTSGSLDEAKKWYQPTQEGGFVCDWTDNSNTWKLTMEEVAPK